MTQDKKTKKSLFWKIIKRTILIVLVLFIALILFIRSSWGQDIIVNKVTSYISKKTNTKVEIKKLYLSFSGNLLLEGLYLEDKKGDTLVYSKNIEASIALMPLIRGTEFNLKYLDSDGLKANIYRKDSLSKFNYEFLMDAFVTSDTTTVQPAENALEIKLGELNFKDTDITYNDYASGIESSVKLNTLHVESNSIDVEQMRFDINNVTLKDGTVKYSQTKAIATTEEEIPLPFIAIQNLDIKNTRVFYTSVPEYLDADVSVNELLGSYKAL